MINLWYEDSHFNGNMSGPEKLLINLKKSLDQEKVPYAINEEKYKINFLVHYDAPGYKKHEKLEHHSCFIGPQFWVFDQWGQFLVDNPEYYNQLIVPSLWVKNKLITKFNVAGEKISVWPVGIDKVVNEKEYLYDCLVYFKRRNQKDLSKVIDFLNDRKLSWNIISYGTYSEKEFHSLASRSKFCFLIDNTESQGIAINELMGMDIPLFVWDVKEWNDQGEDYKVPATSVPYWSDECGEKFYDENQMEETFDRFYAKLNDYNPKSFFYKELSFKSSVRKLLEIFSHE